MSFLSYSMSKNIATLKSRSGVSHGHWKRYHSIHLIGCAFLLVFYSDFVPKTRRFWDIRLQICRDLENRVKGQSRSLKMSPIDCKFFSPLVPCAPAQEVPLGIGYRRRWSKTRMMGLPDWQRSLTIGPSSAFWNLDRMHERNRQTDGRTPGHSKDRA